MFVLVEMDKAKKLTQKTFKVPYSYVVPVTKMVKLTPWQIFLKDFGSSHGKHYKISKAIF